MRTWLVVVLSNLTDMPAPVHSTTTDRTIGHVCVFLKKKYSAIIVGNGASDLITWLTNSDTVTSDKLLRPMLATWHAAIGRICHRYSHSCVRLGHPDTGGLIFIRTIDPSTEEIVWKKE